MTTPEPSTHTQIQTLRDQALDPKRQMTVDRASGLVKESLVRELRDQKLSRVAKYLHAKENQRAAELLAPAQDGGLI